MDFFKKIDVLKKLKKCTNEESCNTEPSITKKTQSPTTQTKTEEVIALFDVLLMEMWNEQKLLDQNLFNVCTIYSCESDDDGTYLFEKMFKKKEKSTKTYVSLISEKNSGEFQTEIYNMIRAITNDININDRSSMIQNLFLFAKKIEKDIIVYKFNDLNKYNFDDKNSYCFFINKNLVEQHFHIKKTQDGGGRKRKTVKTSPGKRVTHLSKRTQKASQRRKKVVQ